MDDVLPGDGLEAATTHQAHGVIRELDRHQGSVTIAHEAIPELKWPAMVMPFKASAAQLQGLGVGDAVEFRFTDGEMDPQIVSIRRRSAPRLLVAARRPAPFARQRRRDHCCRSGHADGPSR